MAQTKVNINRQNKETTFIFQTHPFALCQNFSNPPFLKRALHTMAQTKMNINRQNKETTFIFQTHAKQLEALCSNVILF